MRNPKAFFVSLFFVCGLLLTAPAVHALPDSFADMVEKYSPAVVNISTSSKPKALKKGNGFKMPNGSPFKGTPFEDFFGDFFEGMPEMPQRQMPFHSLGSGLILSEDGYIVTNNHVVARADDIVVRLNDDKTEYKAILVGHDKKNDLALLKVDTKEKLPTAPLGDSDQLRVGDWVLAIGNPFGLGGTVTSGIVSAKSRHINQGPYDDFIQTDAAINPGNSGGPLFNTKGEVVGINTAILSRSGGSQGIGFAIPSNTVKLIVEQIKEYGKPIRGWLGVRIQTVTPELAQALDLKEQAGALVAGVVDGSPAARAGFQEGDVIVRFGETYIDEMNQLPKVVSQTPVGDEVKVMLIREGKYITKTVKIAQMDEEEELASAIGGQEGEGMRQDAVLGMSLKPLTRAVREEYGMEDAPDGLLVMEVEAGSPAAEAGVRQGDVLVKLDNKPVKTLKDVKEQVEKAGKDKSLLVLLSRGGENLFTAIKLAEEE